MDDYDSETFHIDMADVDKARTQGPLELLELVLEYGGRARDILPAALTNGSPVNLNGTDLEPDTLRSALGGGHPRP